MLIIFGLIDLVALILTVILLNQTIFVSASIYINHDDYDDDEIDPVQTKRSMYSNIFAILNAFIFVIWFFISNYYVR